MKLAVRLATVFLAAGLIAAAAPPLRGTFALQGANAKTHGFLRVSAGAGALDRRVDIWMTPENSDTAIRRYTVDMTKLLHVIIVSDDFKQFLHVHPVLGSGGHFTIDQTFPVPALYHVYADGEPHGAGQQVFRFELPIGGIGAVGRSLTRTGPSVTAGPYTVKLSGTTLHAGTDSEIAVHITRGGKAAANLHPYLGALAHAVFLNGNDLTYVHVHPVPIGTAGMESMPGMKMSDMPGMAGMDMKPLPDSATSAPDMLLHVTLREAGTYKLWVQFRGGKSLYVAPFVITVK